jgi:hypothetical protein
MQNEITSRDRLLNSDGSLKHKGYSRRFLLEYNPDDVRVLPGRRLNRYRLKEWDYYAVTTKTHFFAISVADVGYIGLVFAHLLDFQTKEFKEKMIVTPFGSGCRLPQSSEPGDVHFEKGGVKVNFSRLPGRRNIAVEWPGFAGDTNLVANFICDQPDSQESIVMATPIGERHFYYNHKINCMPAAGEIALGDFSLELTRKDALASMDWGRGAWKYNTFWNWASASGFLPDGRTVGLNLGVGFGDLSNATENCFYIDGKMTKLEAMDFLYIPGEYMKPWRFKTTEGKLDLVFTPFYERVTNVNLLVLTNVVHQMFGKYTGWLETETGERIEVKNLIGWAEECRARW